MLKTLLTLWRRKYAVATPVPGTGYALAMLDLQLREATARLPATRRNLVTAQAGEAIETRRLEELERKIRRQEAHLLQRLGGRGGAAAQAVIVAGMEQERREALRRLQVLRADVARLGQGIAADEARIDELYRCRRLAEAAPAAHTPTPGVKRPAFIPTAFGLVIPQRRASVERRLGIKILF